MKVLHVTNRIYPEYNGGTEIHVFEMCRELANAGQDTVIFTQEVDNRLESVKEKFEKNKNQSKYTLLIPNQQTKRRFFYSIFFKEIFLISYFIKVIEREKPDVIHFHHLIDLSPWLVVIAWIKRIPNLLDLVCYWYICSNIYLTCGGEFHQCSRYCSWQRQDSILERLILRSKQAWLRNMYGYLKTITRRFFWMTLLNSANTILVPISERTREIYIQNGYRASKMITKPCGIETERASDFSKKPSSKLRLGFLGTLLKVKGIEVLIFAFKKIKNHNISLHLYGQNALGDQLLASISKDSRIHGPKSFDHQDLDKILSEIDILIVPSVWEETFGLVVQEALSAKIPVIISRIGGMAERVVDGVNGFTFTPGDADDLTNKLMYVINNHDKVSKKLNYDVGQYSLKMEVSHLVDIYNNLVNKKKLTSVIFSKQKYKWVPIIN